MELKLLVAPFQRTERSAGSVSDSLIHSEFPDSGSLATEDTLVA